MIPPFLYFSMTFVSNTITQRPQVSERLYTGQKEVSAASDGGESRQADDLFPNGPLWDGHVKSAVLCTENRIALVSQFVKVWSFVHKFIANSNWPTKPAQPTNAAIPRPIPSSGTPSGRSG